MKGYTLQMLNIKVQANSALVPEAFLHVGFPPQGRFFCDNCKDTDGKFRVKSHLH